MDKLIEVENIGVRRARRWLIRDVSLSVGKHEIVTLIGPNGGGKTTLVRALLGLIPIDRGRVRRRSGLTIGYVPQKLDISSTLPITVKRFMNLTRHHAAREIIAALEETGVSAFENAQIQDLSGGELRRVLLARAIAMQPDLLVLDEPVQGVDFAGEMELYRLIAEIRARHSCGILLISHDLHIVMAATDSVVCLNGHVCCSGVPADVAVNPEFGKLFGPRGAEAVALYRHRHDHEHGAGGKIIHHHPHGSGDHYAG